MAEAEEEIGRPRRLMPAMEFADTRLRIAKDETIWGKIVQGKLHVWPKAPELCETVLPVIMISCHHLRSVHRGGLSAGLGHPGVSHQHDLGVTSGPEGGLPIGIDQAHRAFQISTGRGDKGIAEPPGPTGRCGDAGTDPERRSRRLERPRANV